MAELKMESVAMRRMGKQATSWCGLNGLMYTDGGLNWSHAPVSLSPNSFPRESFEYASDIQPIINELVDKISRDREFLTTQLAEVAEADPFTKRLLQIYAKQPEKLIKEGVQVGIHRSDYMMNIPSSNDANKKDMPLQIEINTIASSFGCLSQKVGELHRSLLKRNNINHAAFKEEFSDSSDAGVILKASGLGAYSSDALGVAESIPLNESVQKLAFALAFSHFLYVDTKAVVLFVVQPGERNIADQRALEAELWTGHGVRCEFMTMAEVQERGRVEKGSDSDGLGLEATVIPLTQAGGLRVRPDADSAEEVSVSVIYYRAGYSPDDYPSEKEWEARELMEQSSALKCPSVGYQLTGTKRVQQVLTQPGVLELFLDEKSSDQLRKSFAGQYSLGSLVTPEGEKAVMDAIADGSKWVLKPQREGGGNNMYGAELSEYLQTHAGDPLLSGYILMQRIFPTVQRTVFMRKGETEVLDSISELGIYGTYVGDGSSAMMNDMAGYLLRTKGDGVDEGGVATGYSVLNSVALVD